MLDLLGRFRDEKGLGGILLDGLGNAPLSAGVTAVGDVADLPALKDLEGDRKGWIKRPIFFCCLWQTRRFEFQSPSAIHCIDLECENGMTYWREGMILKDYRTSFPCNAVLVGFALSVSAE